MNINTQQIAKFMIYIQKQIHIEKLWCKRWACIIYFYVTCRRVRIDSLDTVALELFNWPLGLYNMTRCIYRYCVCIKQMILTCWWWLQTLLSALCCLWLWWTGAKAVRCKLTRTCRIYTILYSTTNKIERVFFYKLFGQCVCMSLSLSCQL